MYALPFILLWKLQRLAIDARRRRRTWHHLAWTTVSAVTTSLLITVLFVVSYALVYFGMWLMAAFLVGFALMPLIGAWLVTPRFSIRPWRSTSAATRRAESIERSMRSSR